MHALVLALSLLAVAQAQDWRRLEMNLESGWRVTQDVHDIGEKARWFDPDTRDARVGQLLSDAWQPIARLAHLQLLLAAQPYFGRELRSYNDAPWWYRVDFPTTVYETHATLRFEGVDYYGKVWLNGKLLGSHEGYAEPFEFEVGGQLRSDRPNALIVKVWSPWDRETTPGGEADWVYNVIRRMLKGTYEHADTFVQRDVNPVGIWRPVKLLVHDGIREGGESWVRTASAEAASATASVSWAIQNDAGPQAAGLSLRIVSLTDGKVAAQSSEPVSLAAGANNIERHLTVNAPRLWSTWDRGAPALYRADLELTRTGEAPLERQVVFGIRTVELHRAANETRFFLNGKPIYLRGTTYWPDVYISGMDRARYQRDVAAAMRAGFNAFRIHVHTENPEFYEICDRMGMAVIQDFDLNWVFPQDAEFTARAVHLFGAKIRQLRNHPSILAWIPMNEAGKDAATVRPGPQLVAEAKSLDPTRPTIRNSSARDDPESGDGHDYRGSLGGGKYTDIYGTSEKLATEFGVDAPPPAARLSLVPVLAERLKDVLPQVGELHDYQYRLLKYYVEHYRIQKYAPNAGYFQFMFIDFCPQSFYGIYDYWGAPKVEGLGGGLRAMLESNQPVGVFMEYKDAPVAIHAVNDTSADLGEVTAKWRVTVAGGELVTEGTRTIPLGPDSHVRVADLNFEVAPNQTYHVTLNLESKDGKLLSHNEYVDPFRHPPRPEGFPERMDHELGMRLWWAGRQ
ncbi:MAG: glycoside hydrolase family 2 TIM barrel-domain containing protein [Bryobacteraceae bacterium]